MRQPDREGWPSCRPSRDSKYFSQAFSTDLPFVWLTNLVTGPFTGCSKNECLANSFNLTMIALKLITIYLELGTLLPSTTTTKAEKWQVTRSAKPIYACALHPVHLVCRGVMDLLILLRISSYFKTAADCPAFRTHQAPTAPPQEEGSSWARPLAQCCCSAVQSGLDFPVLHYLPQYSRPLSRWCHPTMSSFLAPFSSCPQSFPASESFPMSRRFTSGGQSIGALA